MKNLYSSILIVIVALFLFAAVAVAKPPFWDDQVNSPGRFKKLSEFSNAAVFDKETGLVWEQSPATTTHTWSSARFQCTSREVGGRKGWRLPSVHELASLVDPNESSPALPNGHPFTLTSAQEDGSYWSASTSASDSSLAWGVTLGSGFVGDGDKDNGFFVWCVRGGMNADAY